ncbi:MAG TPA: UDP-N-acetylmuramoyl-tripeptide--D-alanyl-D-alanine ligase [Parafilimonas sp.]|nr:UDP-N-acetylmuramoyl-tripeptide--D-alanyl-D-alanine ligase [Parafilimonas sp.]
MIISELYKIYLQFPSVQTDTRKLQPGDIFFALKGENFNGNLFALKALELGAAYAVIDEDINAPDIRLIQVDDVLESLQQLAKFHRDRFTIPFIAITGSNGKTTTRELVSTVLSSHYKTYSTIGNLNNHIGIPLTILKIKSNAEIAVIEMGANHQKEIESYCKIAQPTHGIISNIGKAHLEGFGGIEGVRKGKGELYDFLRAHNGTAFAFDDLDYLHEMSAGIKEVIWFGTNNGEVCGNVKAYEPFLEVDITKGTSFNTVKTNLVGDYNLPNILCAVMVGKYFNVPDEKIKFALENYLPTNSRSQLIEIGTNKIILDAYNANPSSMKVAIGNFANVHADKKILVLGGMMELGEASMNEHKKLLLMMEQYDFAEVILVGGNFEKEHGNYKYFQTAEAAAEYMQQRNFQHSYFLIKGSRSTQMEKVLTVFTQ